ncbi:esterase-like activity of phytase family protein [Actinomadura rugatobispora]|uniref:Esterase-like activity of phytase family protein n=1 Tax=Actinomadura rugatobispora TaxID=1994 RepID=A0ABW1A5Q6_9ACTN|nr:esterase-like activity of phytase family protein [Actinomadura rugatobispora]
MTGWRIILAATAAATGLCVVGTGPPSAEARAKAVEVTRFLGEQRVPHKTPLDGTTVGGLSGFDRDPRTGTWYFVSDDRWRYNPARFYTGSLEIDRVTGAFTGVRLTGVTTLRRQDGTPYPPYGQPESADPETIRFDPRSRRLLWGNEGDRPAEGSDIPVSDQFIGWTDGEGRDHGRLRKPGNLDLTDTDRGPRRNFGFEALAVTPHTIAAAIEGPRYEDGEPPTVRRGAPARITTWNRAGTVRGQYAYAIDPLPTAPDPPDGHTDTGISEILAIDDHRYLALERSWLEGVGYKVKLYEFDLRGATNVLSRPGLTDGRPYRPVAKRLVLDLSTVRPPVQNLEGLAWGPRLATGECTLVVGSDDNFDSGEVTQFLAFATRGC